VQPIQGGVFGNPYVQCDPVGESHGTIMAWLVGGAITQGQDPNITDAQERLRRTGVAPEASLHYYTFFTAGDLVSAYFTALVNGADVISNSWSTALPLSGPPGPGECSRCDPDCDPGGINGWFRIAQDVGAMSVSGTSNLNNKPDLAYPADVTCNSTHPSYRPEVIAIGGVTDNDYDTSSVAPFSGRGWIDATIGGSSIYSGLPVQIPAVSLVAPGFAELYFAEEQEYGDTSVDPLYPPNVGGVSVSAPIVAAAAGLLRQQYIAQTLIFPETWHAMLLSMGDGAFPRHQISDTQKWVFGGAGVSEIYGAGRFKYKSFPDLAPPSGLLISGFLLEELDEVRFSIPQVATGSFVPENLVWSVYIDEDDLSEVPYVLAYVEDTCTGDVLMIDPYLGFQKHISLRPPTWFFHDVACIELVVSGISVAGGGVWVYNTAYYEGF